MSETRAGVVVDPSLPPEIAASFRENAVVLSRIRAGWRPDGGAEETSSARRLLGYLGAIAGVVLGVLLLYVDGSQSTGILLLAATVLFGAAALVIGREPREDQDRTLYDDARWYASNYFLPEDFDRAAHVLMARAQRATRSVLESAVHAEGLLDDVGNTVTLPHLEWEIARLLAKLSALREEHREFVGEGLTAEAAAVAEPLERALATSEAAVVARIEALERDAGHVADAERAYIARRQIEELRSRLPKYEELLAESGVDSFASQEICRLSDDADRLERALRHSVSSAHEAFRHLES